ncbi:hypothetical protein Hanom_Chr12g01102541 [Helianthus anomalus]
MLEKGITLCELWVAIRENEGPPLNTSPFWEHVHQEFCNHRGDAIRHKHALYSRFRMIHVECMRFEAILNNVDHDDGELNEGDVIQIAYVEYHNMFGCDFKHYVVWQITRF